MPLCTVSLLPVARCQSSGPLGALLSSPALCVRLPTALQVLQVRAISKGESKYLDMSVIWYRARLEAVPTRAEGHRDITRWDANKTLAACGQSLVNPRRDRG